jgi:hypothetical protein
MYDRFLLTILLILSVVLAWMNYSGFFELHIRVGPFFIHHWFSLAGSIYIAFFTPLYYYLKRKRPGLTRTLLRLHTYGNVVSFGLISIHFSQHISRPAAFYPDLQTGLALYLTVVVLVLTGYLMRYRLFSIPYSMVRFLHVSSTTAFYFVIWIHILHGFGIINA